jgi:methylthioribose-1-phosphate isomerase
MSASSASLAPVALRWDGRHLQILDQTLLPAQERWLELGGADDTAAAIARLAVRGAPNIGISAAYGLAMEAAHAGEDALAAAAGRLRRARPTAVNLAWAVDRVLAAALAAPPAERGRSSSRSATTSRCSPARRVRCCRAHG